MYKHILVATDNSSLSQKAEKAALKLAKSLGSRLSVLTAVERYQHFYMEGTALIPAQDVEKLEQQWVQNAKNHLARVETSAAKLGVNLQVLIAKSDAVAETIIATANKHKCDLIIMASHGRRGITRILLGSQTQHVLTHSKIPVLVIR